MDATRLNRQLILNLTPNFLGQYRQNNYLMYIFECAVEVQNLSQSIVQLQDKEWHIYSDTQQPTEIIGASFQGQQPILKPDEKYTYTSLLPLHTVFAFIQGSYKVLDLASKTTHQIITPKIVVTPKSFLN
jgi:ApaG protein